MKPASKSGRGLFHFDIDTKEPIEEIRKYICELTTIKRIHETKNGYHILTEPFDRKKFLYSCKDCELKIDSLLFVEAI